MSRHNQKNIKENIINYKNMPLTTRITLVVKLKVLALTNISSFSIILMIQWETQIDGPDEYRRNVVENKQH